MHGPVNGIYIYMSLFNSSMKVKVTQHQGQGHSTGNTLFQRAGPTSLL